MAVNYHEGETVTDPSTRKSRAWWNSSFLPDIFAPTPLPAPPHIGNGWQAHHNNNNNSKSTFETEYYHQEHESQWASSQAVSEQRSERQPDVPVSCLREPSLDRERRSVHEVQCNREAYQLWHASEAVPTQTNQNIHIHSVYTPLT